MQYSEFFNIYRKLYSISTENVEKFSAVKKSHVYVVGSMPFKESCNQIYKKNNNNLSTPYRKLVLN